MNIGIWINAQPLGGKGGLISLDDSLERVGAPSRGLV